MSLLGHVTSKLGRRNLGLFLCSRTGVSPQAAQSRIPQSAHNPKQNKSLLTPQLSSFVRNFSSSDADIQQKIDTMLTGEKVFVFMKGVPAAPQCGFSNAVVQILRMHDVPFNSFNVLSDEEIRQGIKEYSNWPTIPQVYFDGEFVAGCDILLQMHQNGDLIEELQKIGIKSALLE